MNKKIYIDRYIMYGLNHRRNFLKHTEIGVSCDTHEEMIDFSYELLKMQQCDNCALFFIMKNGTYEAFFKTIYDNDEAANDSDQVELALCNGQGTDEQFFAELDGKFRFCCYSLLIETEDGRFEVCK